MKHLFVINPHSFRRRPDTLKQVLSEIENSFSNKGKTDYKIHISRYSRDAISVIHCYIKKAGNETVRVYAVGGDGILFDCLNGMVNFPNAELTSVPYGNANDFIRSFGVNVTDKFRDIKNLSVGRSHPVDIINCGSNYAMNELNIGIIGQTIINANKIFPYLPAKWLRKHIGLAYSICALKALFNTELIQQQYTVFVDGEELNGNYCNIHLANTAVNGGTLIPSPYAMPNSGSFEVLFANTSSLIRIATAIGEYNKGNFEKYDFFVHRKCRKLEVKSDTFLRVEMDGEGFIARELQLEIIPGGIKFFAPEGLDFMDYSHMAYNNKKSGGKQ